MPRFHAGYLRIGDDGELTRAVPSLAPVRWLHARPSVFWNLPEREFGAALDERRRGRRVRSLDPSGAATPFAKTRETHTALARVPGEQGRSAEAAQTGAADVAAVGGRPRAR
jgi:hypothetical protein